MTIGLSKEELVELGYFGKTEEESINKLFGTSSDWYYSVLVAELTSGLLMARMCLLIRDS